VSRKLVDACKQADCRNPLVALKRLHTTSRNMLRVFFGRKRTGYTHGTSQRFPRSFAHLQLPRSLERGVHTHGVDDDLRCARCAIPPSRTRSGPSSFCGRKSNEGETRRIHIATSTS